MILKAFNLKERKIESHIFLRVKHYTKNTQYIITMVVRNKTMGSIWGVVVQQEHKPGCKLMLK